MRYDKIRSRVRQNSFSFENMIVIVIILIFFVIIGGTCATKFISSKEKATAAAMQYREAFHPEWTNVAVMCQDYDTDSNGYVTCTIGAQGQRLESIECPIRFSFNSGCRAARNTFITPNNE